MSDTKYKYISKGPNWAWGRNTAEQTAWQWIRMAAIVGAVLGITIGTLIGLWLMKLTTGSAFGAWPVIWTILLALIMGVGVMILLIITAYKLSEISIAVIKNRDLSQK